MAIGISRPMKGARISDFYPVKQVPPLASIDSAFQLQEYISLLIRHDVHDVETIVSVPGRYGTREREGSDDMRGENKEVDKEIKSDVVVDEFCWIYEQLRRLAQDLSHPLITTLQQECTRATCPEMKAGEWMYLCVAHGNDGSMEQCCAIDYILHTLDSATALLNSPRAFPSRLSIPPTSQRHFPSLARRLGRIFAHAYYHHREAFEQAEAESSLYARFLTLTSKFELVPNEFLVIPPSMQVMTDDRSRERERDIDMRDGWVLRGMPEPSREQATNQLLQNASASAIDLSLNAGRGLSPPGPASDTQSPSPRKGRSRTDTMVFSEAAIVAEELAKGEDFSAADIDKAIAQERILTAEEPSFEEPSSSEVEGESSAEVSESDEDRQATIRFPDTEIPRDMQTKIWEMMQGKEASPPQAQTEAPSAEEHETPAVQPAIEPELAAEETAKEPKPQPESESEPNVEEAAEESPAAVADEKEIELVAADEFVPTEGETTDVSEAAQISESIEEAAAPLESAESSEQPAAAPPAEKNAEIAQESAEESEVVTTKNKEAEPQVEVVAESSAEIQLEETSEARQSQTELQLTDSSEDPPTEAAVPEPQIVSEETHES